MSFTITDEIQYNWQDSDTWYDGYKIVSTNGDGSYKLIYGDGSVESNVPINLLRGMQSKYLAEISDLEKRIIITTVRFFSIIKF
jgi:hypothetical protein